MPGNRTRERATKIPELISETRKNEFPCGMWNMAWIVFSIVFHSVDTNVCQTNRQKSTNENVIFPNSTSDPFLCSFNDSLLFRSHRYWSRWNCVQTCSHRLPSIMIMTSSHHFIEQFIIFIFIFYFFIYSTFHSHPIELFCSIARFKHISIFHSTTWKSNCKEKTFWIQKTIHFEMKIDFLLSVLIKRTKKKQTNMAAGRRIAPKSMFNLYFLSFFFFSLMC